MQIIFPYVLAIDEIVKGNRVRQILVRAAVSSGTLLAFTSGRARGHLFRDASNGQETVVLSSRKHLPTGHRRVVLAEIDSTADSVDASGGSWLVHPALNSGAAAVRETAIRHVLASWLGAFNYVEEDRSEEHTSELQSLAYLV